MYKIKKDNIWVICVFKDHFPNVQLLNAQIQLNFSSIFGKLMNMGNQDNSYNFKKTLVLQ